MRCSRNRSISVVATRCLVALIMAISGALASPAALAQTADEPTAAEEPSEAQPAETETETRTKTVVTETVTKTTKTTEKRVKKPEKSQTRTVAIFIKNRAGKPLAGKVKAFSDLVTANITDQGFRVISREDTIQAIQNFTPEDAQGGKTKLDVMLDKNSSALRLAQKLNANYLIIGSLTSLGQKQQHIQYRGVNRQVTKTTLRVTYKILDGLKGSSLTAGTITSTHQSQQSQTVQTKSNNVVNNLLADAAKKLGNQLEEKGGAAAVSAETGQKAQDTVTIEVTASMQDLTIPAVVKNDQGSYEVTGNQYRLDAMNVSVAIDGTVMGTAPGTFEVRPGLHKMKLTRKGFRDWSRTVNITKDGQTFDVPMMLTDEGMRRWRQNAAFLNDLKTESKITDAQAEKIRGVAQMMRQSGYRIDIRKDQKVDVKQREKIDIKERENVDIKERENVDIDRDVNIEQGNGDRRRNTPAAADRAAEASQKARQRARQQADAAQQSRDQQSKQTSGADQSEASADAASDDKSEQSAEAEAERDQQQAEASTGEPARTSEESSDAGETQKAEAEQKQQKQQSKDTGRSTMDVIWPS